MTNLISAKWCMYVAIPVLFFGIHACASSQVSLKIDPAELDVQQDRIRSHIAFLADDQLMGRYPGQQGFQTAADYVVRQYQSFGLMPAGDNGTFFQAVKIRKGVIEPNASSLFIIDDSSKTALAERDEYIFLGDLNYSHNDVSAAVVFAGYGIDAPNLGYSDYRNKNVRGKIVVTMAGAPDSFPATEAVHFGTYASKFEIAARQGAAGIIIAASDNGFGFAIRQFRESGNDGVLAPNGEVYGKGVFRSPLKFAAVVNGKSLKKILRSDPDQYWDRYRRSLPVDSIPVRISAQTHTQYTDITSYNIIGAMHGGDNHLKDEYLIYTAHLDHLGIGHAVDGDSIYNGAHDNASGVACVLEVARLYSQLSKKPRRSALFMMTTGEEMGLLGSDYFARFPTIDKKQIIANINLDMPTLIAPLLSIEPLGAELSNMLTYVKPVADQLGLEIMADHMPEQVRIVRSDQYNFLKQGIPALHIKYGLKTTDSTRDIQSEIKNFMSHTYHKPSDELNASFDFNAAVTFVKINFLVGYSIMQSATRPVMRTGSVFEIK